MTLLNFLNTLSCDSDYRRFMQHAHSYISDRNSENLPTTLRSGDYLARRQLEPCTRLLLHRFLCSILPSSCVQEMEITIRKRSRTEAVVTQRKFFKKTARGKVIKGECSMVTVCA